MASNYIKCHNNGLFELGGKTCGTVLPNCDPIGCDPAELEQFEKPNGYQKSDGCRAGHVEVNGVILEKPRNICYRTCGDNGSFRSKKKIKCVCDYETRFCQYQIRATNALGWVDWKTTKKSGAPYIPTDGC